MRKFYKITPEGTRDLLFEECGKLNQTENKLASHFLSYGYHPVKTPNTEFYDVFSCISQEKMFKLTDTHGRLMVLRPDNTFPIARLVATSMQQAERPLRISYNQSVHLMGNSLRGASCQFYQSGIELIGMSGIAADLEVLTVAFEAMKKLEADYRFEIGHAQFFKSLISELPIDEVMQEEVRRIIEQKNYAELTQMLEGLEQTQAVYALKMLPRLFGGVEILQQAAELCKGLECVSCLDYLREVYNNLVALGYGDRVIIDLGLVNRNEYYTGLVFGCYINDVGDSVLSGGRYDHLFEQFGAADAAIGFAVNVSAITSHLMRTEGYSVKKADILVAWQQDDCAQVEAVKAVRALLSENSDKTVINQCFKNKQQAEKFAAQNEISEIKFVGEGFKNA